MALRLLGEADRPAVPGVALARVAWLVAASRHDDAICG